MMLAVVARLLLPVRYLDMFGDLTKPNMAEGEVQVNKWLEEMANERARECGVKEGGCPYMR